MEQTIHTPETYDFRKYDQIWRGVAPHLGPPPPPRGAGGPAGGPPPLGAPPRAPPPPGGGGGPAPPPGGGDPPPRGPRAGGTGSDRRVHRSGAGR